MAYLSHYFVYLIFNCADVNYNLKSDRVKTAPSCIFPLWHRKDLMHKSLRNEVILSHFSDYNHTKKNETYTIILNVQHIIF